MKKIENMAMDIEYDGRLVLDGQIMPEMVPDGATPEEKEAIHKRMHALWTAARGMSTAEAVSLLNGTHDEYITENIPEDDESDMICHCGDPDCSRPFGHPEFI